MSTVSPGWAVLVCAVEHAMVGQDYHIRLHTVADMNPLLILAFHVFAFALAALDVEHLLRGENDIRELLEVPTSRNIQT